MTLKDLQKKEYLFDSHAHLSKESNVDEVIERAKNDGIMEIFDISVDTESSIKSVELSSQRSSLYSVVGMDPELVIPGSGIYKNIDNIDQWIDEEFKTIEKLAQSNSNNVIGIGESGIDLYHLGAVKADSEDIRDSKKNQIKLFEKHLQLAEKLNLFLSIHSRGAEELCLEIVRNYNAQGIFHSYTGSYETAKKILDSGWGLGINGIVTFKNAHELRELYSKIVGNLDTEVSPNFFYRKNLFFETDSPFLSPEGQRGEKNAPANIKVIYEIFTKFLRGNS